jgi:soluble lytic murein transglycosylase
MYTSDIDLRQERNDAAAWVRLTFNLPADTDLDGPDALANDPRFVRGAELWSLGLYEEARAEFENLRESVSQDPAASFRLGSYLIDLGLYRPGINAIRQVLTLAGMDAHTDSLDAPAYFNHIRYGMYYRQIVEPAAALYGYHPLFLYSVIRQESLFEGFVGSTAGARGLMQITPPTGDSLAKSMGWPPNYTSEDLYRPVVSINMGAYYLAYNRNRLGDNPFAALAAYNAGPGNAAEWQDLAGGDPDLFLEVVRFSETRDYIRGIYEIYAVYLQLYSPEF